MHACTCLCVYVRGAQSDIHYLKYGTVSAYVCVCVCVGGGGEGHITLSMASCVCVCVGVHTCM